MPKTAKTFREKVEEIFYQNRYAKIDGAWMYYAEEDLIQEILSAHEAEIKRLKREEPHLPKPTKKKFNLLTNQKLVVD